MRNDLLVKIFAKRSLLGEQLAQRLKAKQLLERDIQIIQNEINQTSSISEVYRNVALNSMESSSEVQYIAIASDEFPRTSHALRGLGLWEIRLTKARHGKSNTFRVDSKTLGVGSSEQYETIKIICKNYIVSGEEPNEIYTYPPKPKPVVPVPVENARVVISPPPDLTPVEVIQEEVSVNVTTVAA